METIERDDRGIWGKALVAMPAIVLGGLLAGWLSNSGMDNGWYASLAKPGIQPPSYVFGPVWAALYALMGLALAVIWNEPPSKQRSRAFGLFFIQLGLNFACRRNARHCRLSYGRPFRRAADAQCGPGALPGEGSWPRRPWRSEPWPRFSGFWLA